MDEPRKTFGFLRGKHTICKFTHQVELLLEKLLVSVGLKRNSKNMNYKLLVEKAKKYINKGSANMGGKIENVRMLDLDHYMVASTFKAIRLTEAIVKLCEADFTEESLPILRSLIEHTINMRWIMAKDTEKRLQQYLRDWDKKRFGERWTNINLADRMSEIGFKDRNYFDFVVKYTYSYAHVNASTLDWEKVMYKKRRYKKRSPQYIYSIVAQMLGHVLFALNTKYKGKFNYYREIWSHIKGSDKDIREELEAIFSETKA